LPGSLARQSCPAVLPGSLARQSCPAVLPGSLARQSCPAVLPGNLNMYNISNLGQSYLDLFRLGSYLNVMMNLMIHSDLPAVFNLKQPCWPSSRVRTDLFSLVFIKFLKWLPKLHARGFNKNDSRQMSKLKSSYFFYIE
jgi:hypothetical protein